MNLASRDSGRDGAGADEGAGLESLSPEAYVGDPFDVSIARLERYELATYVDPPPDIAKRIIARVSREPESTPARRFIEATSAHDRSSTLRALRQSLAVALGAGRARTVVRVQAAMLVLAVLASLGVSGAAAMAGAGAGIELVTAVAREALSKMPQAPRPEPRTALEVPDVPRPTTVPYDDGSAAKKTTRAKKSGAKKAQRSASRKTTGAKRSTPKQVVKSPSAPKRVVKSPPAPKKYVKTPPAPKKYVKPPPKQDRNHDDDDDQGEDDDDDDQGEDDDDDD